MTINLYHLIFLLASASTSKTEFWNQAQALRLLFQTYSADKKGRFSALLFLLLRYFYPGNEKTGSRRLFPPHSRWSSHTEIADQLLILFSANLKSDAMYLLHVYTIGVGSPVAQTFATRVRLRFTSQWRDGILSHINHRPSRYLSNSFLSKEDICPLRICKEQRLVFT